MPVKIAGDVGRNIRKDAQRLISTIFELEKPVIAAVNGTAAGLGFHVALACDLIVAAEGTTFADVVGARLGMCGVEYFAHPWEFGPRKAKELLLTGDSIDADEAQPTMWA